MTLYSREYPFRQVGSSVPAVSPPLALLTLSLFAAESEYETENAFTSVQTP